MLQPSEKTIETLYIKVENTGIVLQQLLASIMAMASSQSSRILTTCSRKSPKCVEDREILMRFIWVPRLVKYFVSNHLLLGNWMNQQVATMFKKTGQAPYSCTLVQDLRSHIHSAAMLSAIGLARKMRQLSAQIIWLFLL